MIIDDIDFSVLYQQHMQQANRTRKEATHWDQKAEKMAVTCANPQDPYLQHFRSLMDFQGAETLLDVGCGPGSVCLSIADQFKQIIGIDYSSGMLTAAQQRADAMGIAHTKFISKAWEDDWSDLPPVDIAVASRSTLVMDLKNALLKLNRQARLRVYTTHTVHPTFVDINVIRAIGREVITLPTYIYAVNILNQMGIHAQVDFIRSPQNHDGFDSFETFAESVEWSLKNITEQETEKLRQYYEKCCQSGQKVTYPSRDWAMVSWDVVAESELTL